MSQTVDGNFAAGVLPPPVDTLDVSMSDKLAPSADEFRAMAGEAIDFLSAFYGSLSSRPVVIPTTSREIHALLDEPLPRAGAAFPGLIEAVRDVTAEYSRHNAHPRFFGYVASPGTAVTALANMLAPAMNINVACWRSAPAGTDVEHLTI